MFCGELCGKMFLFLWVWEGITRYTYNIDYGWINTDFTSWSWVLILDGFAKYVSDVSTLYLDINFWMRISWFLCCAFFKPVFSWGSTDDEPQHQPFQVFSVVSTEVLWIRSLCWLYSIEQDSPWRINTALHCRAAASPPHFTNNLLTLRFDRSHIWYFTKMNAVKW